MRRLGEIGVARTVAEVPVIRVRRRGAAEVIAIADGDERNQILRFAVAARFGTGRTAKRDVDVLLRECAARLRLDSSHLYLHRIGVAAAAVREGELCVIDAGGGIRVLRRHAAAGGGVAENPGSRTRAA